MNISPTSTLAQTPAANTQDLRSRQAEMATQAQNPAQAPVNARPTGAETRAEQQPVRVASTTDRYESGTREAAGTAAYGAGAMAQQPTADRNAYDANARSARTQADVAGAAVDLMG
ncbi:MAG: hypothetical protein LBC70_05500 [Chitinispirillales bacterium]|jgi:rare lipoprotein A (peptidoglycan hydrolase)|nr:hypothetical protein [Chitinispirillales bacterium]